MDGRDKRGHDVSDGSISLGRALGALAPPRITHTDMNGLRFAPSAIEQWPIEKLLPYANNPRVHDGDLVARIAASIAQFGWVVPALIDDRGVLVAGHGRLLAAQMLGLKDIPVIRLSHLSDAESRALRIADNRLTDLSSDRMQ